MRSSIQNLKWLPLLTLAFGCEKTISHSNDVVDPAAEIPEYYDQYIVDLGNRKMDILFVIDNSGSMADQQTILADSFNSFISSFVERQIDYHIGVISTDNRPSGDSFWTSGWGNRFFHNGPNTLLWSKANEAAGASAPAQKFLDRSMGAQVVIDAFKNNVKLGSDGSGDEAALLSIGRFLADDRQIGWNEGFLRDTSLFSTVIISDEDESRTTCTVDPNLPGSLCGQATGRPNGNSYVFADAAAKEHRFGDFRSTFVSQRSDRPGLLRLDAVNVKPTGTADRYDASCVASGERDGSQGKAYAEIVAEFGGTQSSICGNFAPDIEALGELISSSIEREFVLAKNDIDASTVVVEVNGSALATDQYNYDAAANRVRLSDSFVDGLDLLAGSITVKIRYKQNVGGIN